MNTDSTATGQQKTGSGTPFDEITTLEKAEATRLQKELEAMNKELDKATTDVVKRKDEAMNQYKTAAAKELAQLKDTELSTIITDANNTKEAKIAQVQSKAKENKKQAVQSIITEFLKV